MRNFIAKLIPFILLGIAIVAFGFGLVLLTYLLFFGAIIGLIMFFIAWIKERFFPSKHLIKPRHTIKRGRTIDHDMK